MWKFNATHLLVGRLRPMPKLSLMDEFDIISKILNVEYDKEKLNSSFDQITFRLFPHGDPVLYHCLLTLIHPIVVSSSPGGLTDISLPIFSFAYKAFPHAFLWEHLRGTPFSSSKMYRMRAFKLCKKA